MGKPKPKNRSVNPIRKAVKQVEGGVKAAVPLVALLAPHFHWLDPSHSAEYKAKQSVRKLTGWNMFTNKLEPMALVEGWGAFGLSKLVIKVANTFMR